MKTLIPFSGGVDSIYALFDTLKNTSDEVTAVFFDGSQMTVDDWQRSNMRGVEDNTYTALRWNRLQEIKTVIETESRPFTLAREYYTINGCFLNGEFPNTYEGYITNWAAPQINAGSFDRILFAHQRENDGYSRSISSTYRPAPGVTVALDVFKAKATRGTFDVPFISGYTSAVAMSNLPQSIMNVQRSCSINLDKEAPDVECGQCFKCCTHTLYRRMLVEGRSTDQIYDYLTARSMTMNSEWITMKFWLQNENVNWNTKYQITAWPIPVWPSSYTVPG